MIFKKFKPFLSPSVFSFKDPDSGREFSDSNMLGLRNQVRAYRKANELEELEFLETVIENHLCSLPVHTGMCTPIKNPKRSVIQWVRGGVALLKNIAYSTFVEQSEADRRSTICAKCPQNVFPDRGFFLKWAEDMAQRSVGNRKSQHHDELGICGVCSCPSRSKVWYNGKIKLSTQEISEMKKLNCWQPEFAEEVKTNGR